MSILDFIGQFIIFIIPGMISLTIIQYLIGKSSNVDMFNIVYIFGLSATSFLASNLINLLINYFFKMHLSYMNITQLMSGDTNNITWYSFLIAIVSAIVISAIATRMISTNTLFRCANFLKITQREDNDYLWDNLFFNNPWIIFRDFSTHFTYFGRVKKVSDLKVEREIILEEVKVYNDNGEELYQMKEIYLCRKSEDFSIEIDNYDEVKENER